MIERYHHHPHLSQVCQYSRYCRAELPRPASHNSWYWSSPWEGKPRPHFTSLWVRRVDSALTHLARPVSGLFTLVGISLHTFCTQYTPHYTRHPYITSGQTKDFFLVAAFLLLANWVSRGVPGVLRDPGYHCCHTSHLAPLTTLPLAGWVCYTGDCGPSQQSDNTASLPGWEGSHDNNTYGRAGAGTDLCPRDDVTHY